MLAVAEPALSLSRSQVETTRRSGSPETQGMTTTLSVYKKVITPAVFQKGMKQLEAAGKK
jgi:hypothetical protein